MGDKPERRLATAEIVSRSFGVIMVVLYIMLGTTIIFRASQMRNIPELYAKIFGGLMILYGIFRAFKLYRRIFSGYEEK